MKRSVMFDLSDEASLRCTRARIHKDCETTADLLAHLAEVDARHVPLVPQRFGLQVTLPQRTHDKLRRVQELLGSEVARRDLAQVLDRALDALLEALERKRVAATDDPRARRRHADGRYIPAQLRREVWHRDGGQFAFRGPDGRRCESRRDLEYDPVVPMARGGTSTTTNLRLLCRGHNPHEADRVLGTAFMDHARTHEPGPT